MAVDELKFPSVNGLRHAFSSAKIQFAGSDEGIPFAIRQFIKSIDYSRTRDRAEVRANHPDPIAHTQGENSYKCTAEVYRAEFVNFVKTLGPGYGDRKFSIFITWGISGFDTVTDEILGCSLDDTGTGGSQGPDPTVVKLDFKPLKILFCGIDDLAEPLAQP